MGDAHLDTHGCVWVWTLTWTFTGLCVCVCRGDARLHTLVCGALASTLTGVCVVGTLAWILTGVCVGVDAFLDTHRCVLGGGRLLGYSWVCVGGVSSPGHSWVYVCGWTLARTLTGVCMWVDTRLDTHRCVCVGGTLVCWCVCVCVCVVGTLVCWPGCGTVGGGKAQGK